MQIYLAATPDKLREAARWPKPLDLFIANYVYEHVEDNTRKVMGYKNVFPTGQIFTWDSIRHFRTSQYLLMHSVIYRTQLLRDCRLELPPSTGKRRFLEVAEEHILERATLSGWFPRTGKSR